MTFDDDIVAQGSVLRRVLSAYRDAEHPALRAVRSLAPSVGPVIFAGMGGSLAAAGPAVLRLVAAGRMATAMEAGELLHYAFDAITPDTLVVLVSQSGQSAETLKLGRRIREERTVPVVLVSNSETSPMASVADVTVSILAGEEATVSTKTFLTTVVVLNAIADAIAGHGGNSAELALRERVPDLVDVMTQDRNLVAAPIEALADVSALVITARGPALAAADYGALILKETVRIPAESLPAGSFRHGPIEIAGPKVGLIVLAPNGSTRDLSLGLAMDSATCGSPTWIVTDSIEVAAGSGVAITRLPVIPEQLAPLLFSIPLQRFASALARHNGLEPGVLRVAGKVTDHE